MRSHNTLLKKPGPRLAFGRSSIHPCEEAFLRCHVVLSQRQTPIGHEVLAQGLFLARVFLPRSSTPPTNRVLQHGPARATHDRTRAHTSSHATPRSLQSAHTTDLTLFSSAHADANGKKRESCGRIQRFHASHLRRSLSATAASWQKRKTRNASRQTEQGMLQ